MPIFSVLRKLKDTSTFIPFMTLPLVWMYRFHTVSSCNNNNNDNDYDDDDINNKRDIK